MSDSLTDTQEVKQLLNRVAGMDQRGGNERLKRIVRQIVTDLCRTIETFERHADRVLDRGELPDTARPGQ